MYLTGFCKKLITSALAFEPHVETLVGGTHVPHGIQRDGIQCVHEGDCIHLGF